MKPHEEILLTLPSKFTRRDFIQKVSQETAYSYSHSQNLLDAAIHEGQIQRVDRGTYLKVNQQEMELS